MYYSYCIHVLNVLFRNSDVQFSTMILHKKHIYILYEFFQCQYLLG